MPLSIPDRGMLEQIIDIEITSIENTIKVFRNPKVKSLMQIGSEEDYVLGLAMGHIMGKFEAAHVALHAPTPMSEEESEEAIKIMFKRIKEIKEAIFKSG